MVSLRLAAGASAPERRGRVVPAPIRSRGNSGLRGNSSQKINKNPLQRDNRIVLERWGCKGCVPTTKLKEMKTMEHEATSRMSLGLHPRRILGVIDFEAGSQEVLDCALQYAEMHGASVYFLHVIENASFLSGMGEVVLALSEEEKVEQARIALLAFM